MKFSAHMANFIDCTGFDQDLFGDSSTTNTTTTIADKDHPNKNETETLKLFSIDGIGRREWTNYSSVGYHPT